jgi:HlyD family secretion protein
MSAPELKLAPRPGAAMDRKVVPNRWSPATWSVGTKVGLGAATLVVIALLALKLLAGGGERTLRLPRAQVTVTTVERGLFHDLIPLRARIEPRDTVFIDAVDGGRVNRVLVEPGDLVEAGQPMIELGNTNLQLQVIQQESQLNQAISQLQQNEIALEQNKLANERAIAEVDYNLVRLGRAARRRESLAAQGAASVEQRDEITDEFAHYQRLKPIQADSGQRQSDLRDRLLPDIRHQMKLLRANLDVVHGKLDGLIVRAPVSGRVTAIDLKVGENRNPGQRLAEVTPETGMKLSADVDEFYLSRVRPGQVATVDLDGISTKAAVRRVSPQVKEGHFTIDLDFDGSSPPNLVAGKSAQGRLQLGGDTPATILPVGPFLERTGGDWLFVVAKDGTTAERRRIKVGRRTTEQLEILSGLAPGEQAITSDYTGLDNIDRVILTD